MDPSALKFDRTDIENPARRTVLAGLLTAYTAALIPWALAEPAHGAEHGAFAALSAILVGRAMLDSAQTDRLFDQLAADDKRFAADAQALLDVINQRHIDPLQLQQVLDAEQSPLAPLPRQIMTAWCLGVAGSGEQARCVAYETAMNAQMVADVLKPPTYAYGVYGSWETKPASKEVG
ncbi:MAG: sugar dehydrogenase complex small subunit [Rudaea sp.]